ncbi:Protein kinase-like (PK-like) [Diplocarpon rosae]|nr:Protein kinase-like (PK-like) [Diplocarpon rosae]
MSSAALQAAPHQPTTIGAHSPVTAPASSRPYTASSAQSRDAYYNQPAANASPSSTRRPSRRSSGNGVSANPHPPPPPQQYYSPSGSTPNPVSNSRASSSSHPPSPGAATQTPSGYPVMSPGDHQRGVPPVVSARTSSSRTAAQAAVATAADRTRRPAPESAHPPRPAATAEGPERGERQRSHGKTQVNGEDPAVAAANAATKPRRRAQQAPPETIPARPSGSREPRDSQAASAGPRPAMAVAAPAPASSGPSREPSAVLNRVVVSKPEGDVDRERERMAEAVGSSPVAHSTTPGGLSVVGSEGVEDGGRGGSRSRHDHSTSKREKSSKFGDYYLGNTLGEGEFGKVKMGWKQEGGVQVAVKLIRRDSVGTNPTRLAKIYREIAILREISHPNIVRLHEMVETEKQIGIILEYASGGELFDYILNHRYLKDNAARRLFAQLVSGVGYLHKKGIVHRDLKLENLLLDRNRNIIVTDFGFANTFNPDDELGEEIEYNLASRDYVKRMELDKVLPGGHRRGDLMQTSCGSPCYAAPELVVSDSLYTGRKVDVWSCGVILYAMLAGYLPFDDDPANPEGDNINLLYKYIVSTPLTFPEYVTPHARDLLRRILVPDPRKRADLFEVARHSWLSEYSHVVGFITSTTTTTEQIGTTTVGDEQPELSLLNRSASVREPSKQKSPAAVGDLARKHGNVDPEGPEAHAKVAKDNKRRTVQVEYVAPKSQTQRGEPAAPAAPPPGARTRARAGSHGPVEVPPMQPTRRQVSTEKPLPQDPPAREAPSSSRGRRGSHPSRQPGMPAPRPDRPPPRSAFDANCLPAHAPPPVSNARPNTGGSMTSSSSRPGSLALRDRGSYSQPAAPTVAGTNAQGRMSQPKTKHYDLSAPVMGDEADLGRSSANHVPANVAPGSGCPAGSVASSQESKGHKRSNTIGSIFGRTNSVFGGSREKPERSEKSKRAYPPVSNHERPAEREGERPETRTWSPAPPPCPPPTSFRPVDSAPHTESETSLHGSGPRYPPGFHAYAETAVRQPTPPSSHGPHQPPPSRAGRGLLQKNNRKFGDAYEQEPGNGYGPPHSGHAGSSGAARKVMDFFRRRGRDRGQ